MQTTGTQLMDEVSSMEVIVKITERCNINCTYCYMFNRGNEDYLKHPPSISSSTIEAIASFLSQGIDDLKVKHVSVVLHGGEPLMLRKSKFVALCKALENVVSPKASLSIGLQTNGMLIDEEWIEIFSSFKIGVGISLDGPPEYHNLERVNHKGEATYDETARGIQLLVSAARENRISAPGAICVINPEHDARAIYRHFVDDLGFRFMSFNLPMETHDSIRPEKLTKYTTYVDVLLSEWLSDDRPDLKIRLFSQAMHYFSGAKATIEGIQNTHRSHLMIVIASNGDISEHDDFKVINFGQNAGNVRTTTALEFANSRLRQFLANLHQSLPFECDPCGWKSYCRAGSSHGLTISRYSLLSGFNKRSVYCSTFQALFEKIAIYLLRRGLPKESLENALSFQNDGPLINDNIDYREFITPGRKVIPVAVL